MHEWSVPLAEDHEGIHGSSDPGLSLPFLVIAVWSARCGWGGGWLRVKGLVICEGIIAEIHPSVLLSVLGDGTFGTVLMLDSLSILRRGRRRLFRRAVAVPIVSGIIPVAISIVWRAMIPNWNRAWLLLSRRQERNQMMPGIDCWVSSTAAISIDDDSGWGWVVVVECGLILGSTKLMVMNSAVTY